MSPAIWGGLAGALLGGVSFLSLWKVAGTIEAGAKSKEALRPVGILKAVALIDILLFPVLGYFIGPMVVL